MQCKSFGNKPKTFGRIILRTEHARLSPTDNLLLTAAAQKHHNDHIIWPLPWHRPEGHQWWPEQANYHSTDLLPLRWANPSLGSTWAHCPYLDGKVDKTTDIEWIFHQVKYELHMLYQRQVIWHSQSKAGDLFQDITRYLQVQDNTQSILPSRSPLAGSSPSRKPLSVIQRHSRAQEGQQSSNFHTWDVTWCWSKWERCWNFAKISSAVGKASGLLFFLFWPSSPPTKVENIRKQH